MPVDVLGEVATHERAEESADVDTHVVNRKTGVATLGRIALVQVTDDGADVRFQEPGSDHEEDQAQVERPVVRSGDDDRRRQRKMAERDDDAAIQHGQALADDSVGNPAARQGERVDTKCIQAIDGSADFGLESETAARGVRHVENEERAHTVVAEALPEFGVEQGHQPARVTERPPFMCGRRRRGRICHCCFPRLAAKTALSSQDGLGIKHHFTCNWLLDVNPIWVGTIGGVRALGL